MKLERITLENFRQYHGRQRLEFARDKRRRVTVIHGVNGAGKTSLFLAINWCLYGKSFENIQVVENVGELAGKEAVSQAGPGARVRTSVELAFQHNGGRYLVRRAMQGIKQNDGSVEWDTSDDFTMMRTRWDGQTERVDNPMGTMNVILPVNAREYFLFDGEKIDNFAKPEAAEEVKRAIYLVLKLEILERARRHLQSIANDYRKELKRISGSELRGLIERDEKARTGRTKAEERKTELAREIDSARRKIEQIEQQLAQTQAAKALQQQRDRLQTDLRQRHAELIDIVGRIRGLATEAYFVIAQPITTSALQILDEKRERGEIPSSIRRQFVQDLLEQMRCICGRRFAEGGPEHQHLLGLMNSSLPGSLEDDVLDTSAALRSFDDRVQRRHADLDQAMAHRAQLTDSIQSIRAKLDDIGRQLKGSPLEEISSLEKKRQDYLADIDSYNIEIGSLAEQVTKLTGDIAQLEKAIGQARKNEERELLLSKKLELAQRSADAIGEMYQVFADDMRGRIEAKTKEIFRQLIWKDSHFQDILLGPDYNLQVIDRYGLPARPELSAGERQVLSLSFITAMSQISEEEAPLVMDTPFGRLSSHHRNSITQHLPDLADQLVLFVTDEELRDQARKNLEPRIGAEYRLEFDRQTSCTEIVEVLR